MVGVFKNVKIGTKLTAMMAAFVAINVIAMSMLSYVSMRSAVEVQGRATLAGVARLQTAQFEQELRAIDRDLKLQASHPFVVEALQAFTLAFSAFENPREALQRIYIQRNPNPLGQKDKLIKAGTGSTYDLAHETYHPTLDALQDEMGYYDIFLFDTEGNLVYSVFKELDYATNLMSGEWKTSGLGDVFRRANALEATDGSAFVDFAPYGPSAGAPAAFVGHPVFDADGAHIGVLAYQMPIDVLNATVATTTSIGATGEAFLVGADGLLRTDSPLTEGDDVLQRRFDAPALASGLAGQSGMMTYTNDQGLEVLGYFSPVETLATGWVMIVQQDVEELFAQVYKSRNFMVMVGLSAFAVATILAMLFSRSLSTPLKGLNAAVEKISAKVYDVVVPAVARGDEIGGIARALDAFRVGLAEADQGARDAAFKSAAFESTGAPMLLTDLDLKIVGANSAFFRLVNENTRDFGLGSRNLTPPDVVGAELSTLSFPPAEIRAAVVDHTRLPIKKKLAVGDSYVGLLIDLVTTRDGTPVGYVFDMKNQTFQMMSETVLKAIDSQQIRVEMELDGSIAAVNVKCCEALSMPEAEVLRQGGSGFIRQITDGGEKSDIWQPARDGQGTSGRFRITAGGKERVFDGNFSPIPNEDGVPKGFLLIGSDVTDAVAAIDAIETKRKTEAAEQARVVEALSRSLGRLADGDLTIEIPGSFAENYDQLRRDFNETVAKLRETIGFVIENANLIGNEAGGINSAVSELSRRTESQAATLEQTAAAMSELTASVSSSAKGGGRCGADRRRCAQEGRIQR